MKVFRRSEAPSGVALGLSQGGLHARELRFPQEVQSTLFRERDGVHPRDHNQDLTVVRW